jgi:hypothetical protein
MRIFKQTLNEVTEEERAEYDELLRYSVVDIFKGDPEIVDRYQEIVSECTEDEQLLVLHDDPLNVAANITGQTVTEEHLAAYRAHCDA